MKKLIRLISLLLIATLILGFSGCNNQSAYEIYEATYKKTAELKDFDISLDATISYEGSGIDESIPFKSNIKCKLNDDESLDKFYMANDFVFLKQQTKSTFHYIDDVFYLGIDLDGNSYKFKQNITLDELADQYGLDALNKEIFDLPEEALKNATIAEKNGETTMDFVFDGKIIKDELINIINILGYSLNVNSEDITVSDIKASVIIDENGYIRFFSIDTDINMGEDILNIDLAMTLNNPGDEVEITSPTGEYTYYKDLIKFYTDQLQIK